MQTDGKCQLSTFILKKPLTIISDFFFFNLVPRMKMLVYASILTHKELGEGFSTMDRKYKSFHFLFPPLNCTRCDKIEKEHGNCRAALCFIQIFRRADSPLLTYSDILALKSVKQIEGHTWGSHAEAMNKLWVEMASTDSFCLSFWSVATFLSWFCPPFFSALLSARHLFSLFSLFYLLPSAYWELLLW